MTELMARWNHERRQMERVTESGEWEPLLMKCLPPGAMPWGDPALGRAIGEEMAALLGLVKGGSGRC